MAYKPYNPALPDTAVQSLAQSSQSIRDNLRAIRDQLVISGTMPGWAGEAKAADADSPPPDPALPAVWLFTGPNQQQIRLVMTYGNTPENQDCPTMVEASFRVAGAYPWEPMSYPDAPNGRLTINYVDGNVSSFIWS